MNLTAVEARNSNHFNPAVQAISFLSTARFCGLFCRVSYFGITPTDIKPVVQQKSIGSIRSDLLVVVRDRRTKPRKVGSLNSRAFGGWRECRLSLDKLKRIPPALTADAKDGSGEHKGTVFARG